MERLKEDVDRIMRHDLRQPLTAIIGLPQILEEKGNLSEEQLRIIRRIGEAGNRMLHMIDLSLDLFKMETGRYEYHPQRVDAVAVISQLLDHNRDKLSAKKLECRLTIDRDPSLQDEPIIVWSEERLLYSMLSNLLTNALEASPTSNNIRVTITDSESTGITIHNKGAVPKAIRNCFFEKYKSFGKEFGTGLGTYSVKLLANAMHYEISMETSDEEDETSVSVFIPKEP